MAMTVYGPLGLALDAIWQKAGKSHLPQVQLPFATGQRGTAKSALYLCIPGPRVFVRFLGSTFGDSNIILPGAPGRSRRHSRTPPLLATPPAAARTPCCCSHTAPLLAHLTADYTLATDPATARLPPAYCLSSRTLPPLNHLHCWMHTFHLRPLPCRCLRTSLLLTSTHTSPPLAHIPTAAQRMHTPPLLHVYPAAAYAPSPLLLGHPAPLLLSAEWMPCYRSIARRVPHSSPYALLRPAHPLPAYLAAAPRAPRHCPPIACARL
ncbi:hypothetical protein B0H14DRAFT_3535752 [Mycena olivaceomarginata]|nr:hypothetical protein B0H14DRAFT_3535752 [Mycena olivaceomarginata]